MQINILSNVPPKYATLQSPRRQAGAHDLRRALLLLAPRPAYGITLALAGIIERGWELRGMEYLPVAGLDAEATHAMFDTHFPGAQALIGGAWDVLAPPSAFAQSGMVDGMAALLTRHRTVDDEDSRWLAHAVATACLGSDPLWQELRFNSAKLFDDLMHSFFNSIAVCNRNALDWKLFLFQKLEVEQQRYQRVSGF